MMAHSEMVCVAGMDRYGSRIGITDYVCVSARECWPDFVSEGVSFAFLRMNHHPSLCAPPQACCQFCL